MKDFFKELRKLQDKNIWFDYLTEIKQLRDEELYYNFTEQELKEFLNDTQIQILYRRIALKQTYTTIIKDLNITQGGASHSYKSAISKLIQALFFKNQYHITKSKETQ